VLFVGVCVVWATAILENRPRTD